MSNIPVDVPLQSSVSTGIVQLQMLLEIPIDAKEALIMFWQRLERGLFLYLYRKYFPDDYQLSQESEEIDAGWNYSPREVEFFYLTLDHLLPLLDIDYISQVGAEGERATDIIPVLPYEMPWWRDFDQLPLGWQYLRLLSGTLTAEEITEAVLELVGLPKELQTDLFQASLAISASSPVVQAQLRRFFLAHESPYTGFGRVLALYQRHTGIGWLDTHPEDELLYEDYCWCEAHFASLIQEYQAAQCYEEQVNHFADWLAYDVTRVYQLFTLIEQVVPMPCIASITTGSSEVDA